MQRYIPLILATVTTNAVSQLMLKQGMLNIGKFEFSTQGVLEAIPRVIANPYIVAGLVTLVFSMGLHLMALSRVEISFAYPFLSISYVIVLAAGYWLFSEQVNLFRVVGVTLICLGTFFIAHT